MRLEDYFAEDLKIGTTHGVCPECLKKLEEDTRRFYRPQGLPKDSAGVPPGGEPENPRVAV
jgi:hypothetical protein